MVGLELGGWIVFLLRLIVRDTLSMHLGLIPLNLLDCVLMLTFMSLGIDYLWIVGMLVCLFCT